MVFNASDLLPKSSGKPSDKSSKDQNNISEDWTKFGKRQILNIGSKKRYNNINSHDINEDDDIDLDNGYNSSSDEEEGRTSAVREKKRKVVVPPTQPPLVGIDSMSVDDINVVPSSAAKKKKKKKGKKERAKETNAETVADEEQSTIKDNMITTDAPKDVAKEVEQGAAATTKDNTSDGDTKNNNIDSSNVTTTNTKRKRKKVRSRQKNIRKDNRTKEDKPSHLVVGSGVDYAGRPMTKETRIKLGLESTTTNAKYGKGVNGSTTKDVGEMFDSGEWVGGDEDKATADTDKGVAEEDGDQGEGESKQQTKINVGETISLTKIGDCIVGNDVPTTKVSDVGESLNDIKKKGKKLKKRKFKNLVVR